MSKAAGKNKLIEPRKLGTTLRLWLVPYPYALERWSYMLQRVTGVVVSFYFLAHIIETGYVVGGPTVWSTPSYFEAEKAWTETMEALRRLGPLEGIGLTVIGASLALHTINGVRLVLAHFGFGLGKPKRPEYPYRAESMSLFQRILFWASIIFAAITTIFALNAFFG